MSEQLRLSIELDAPKTTEGPKAFLDPAFASNKSSPIHRWVPWIAGFSGAFVGDILERYLNEPGCVIDSFSGVGTTLVEGVLRGHNGFGFEINPYAALASRVKTQVLSIDASRFRTLIERFREYYLVNSASPNYTPKSTPPGGFVSRHPFYSPHVLRKVLIIQDFLASIAPWQREHDLFRLAFASTMVTYSNYSYEPSLGTRKAAGKSDIDNYPVGEHITTKLGEMLVDIEWAQGMRQEQQPTVRIIADSFFNCKHTTPEGIGDILITSPPYLNNYHYNRNTRPHLYWLGLVSSPDDMKKIEHENFGKYWQTVRDGPRVDIAFRIPGSDMEDRIQQIRDLNNERGVYGGNGWANYAAAYLNDCQRFARSVRHILKPGGRAFIVIGNSIIQGVELPTDQYLAQIAELEGLETVQIDIPRAERVGNSIIRSDVRVGKAKRSHTLYEAIIELHRPALAS